MTNQEWEEFERWLTGRPCLIHGSKLKNGRYGLWCGYRDELGNWCNGRSGLGGAERTKELLNQFNQEKGIYEPK